jgi:hypothetical protein
VNGVSDTNCCRRLETAVRDDGMWLSHDGSFEIRAASLIILVLCSSPLMIISTVFPFRRFVPLCCCLLLPTDANRAVSDMVVVTDPMTVSGTGDDVLMRLSNVQDGLSVISDGY